ncbi:AAA family ATPase [Bifidobacterium goeldii]|nr:AAA family ATPase [Bifidobacterium goeldii]
MMDDIANAHTFSTDHARPEESITTIVDALAAVLSCSRDVIELAVATFVAGGHLLLEDVPGVGKTTLARALSIAIGGSSHRIQFTPDLLPSDLTGVSVYSQATGCFDFHPGPLFANIVIADEVNRANPKAQSAMLEAMGERRISVDGNTYDLPDPYFVVATQNPIELEGTYPLPEAQLDRFMTCMSFGYPSASAEAAMLTGEHTFEPLATLRQVCTIEQIRWLRAECRKVMLASPLADYIVALVTATRDHDGVRYGASPRGSLNIAALARARALAEGRGFVMADDVQAVAVPVLAHRLVLSETGYGLSSMEHARAVIDDIVDRTPVPRADAARASAVR